MDLNSEQREYIYDWEILLEADLKLSDKEVIHAQFTKVYLDDTEQWTDLGERITEVQIADSPSTVSDPSGIVYSKERAEDNKSSEEEELDQEAMDRIAMGLPASFGVTSKSKKSAAPPASKKRRHDKDKPPPKDFEFETYWKKYGKIFTDGVEELAALESDANITETKFAKTLLDTKELFRDHKNIEFFRQFMSGKPTSSEDKSNETTKTEGVKELIKRDMMSKSLIASRNRAETFAKKLHQFSFVNGFNVGSKNEDGLFERSKTAKEILSPFEDVSYTLHEPVYYGKMKRKNYSMHPIDFDIVDAPVEAEPIPSLKNDDDPKNFDFSFDPVRDARLVAKNAFKIFGPNTSLIKYWHQRYRLFSKLNDGILMDEEGWFSVTPEIIAKHIADRMVTHKDCVILDAFTGVGGNAIQFALKGALVYAIDLDPIKLRCARQNAKVYGVENRITFICGNFYHIAKSFCQSRPNGNPLLIDSIFLSPPWGGPEYLNKPVFELGSCVPDGFEIFDIAVKISQNIAYFLPRNTSSNQLMQIAAKTTLKKVEIEHNVLNNKIKALTAYYGNLVSSS